MEKAVIDLPYRPVPTAVGLIVGVDEQKKPNVMTAGEVFNIGLKNPCIIGIALRKATYTHGLISGMREFTVNIASAAIADKADLVGSISGRDCSDKFAEYGLTPIPSVKVVPPIIAECPINLECKCLSITEVGDHDLFLGEVVYMRADADKVGPKQRLLYDKMQGLVYAEWEYYAVGQKLGHAGFSRNTDRRPR
jgi:flavin reductase (DIM6/NTAB) family NADH-FMN oxidoreductase RutF